jgi:hypothetical protein
MQRLPQITRASPDIIRAGALFAIASDVGDVVQWALSDPRAAAWALADSLDRRCTHHEGADLARMLDDWAFDPDPDGLDTLDWHATRPDQSFRMRFALTAVLVGARAGIAADQPVLP